MDVHIGSKTGPLVAPLPTVLHTLAEQLQTQQSTWLQLLSEHPERFADLEVQVHQTFQQMADQVVAGLLAQASQPSPTLDDAKKKSLTPLPSPSAAPKPVR